MFARTLRVLATFLVIAALALGQGTTSRAVGVVTDASGGAVIGATVTLTNEATGATFKTTTTQTGNWFFDSLQPGTYTVTIEAAGFQKFISRGNTVSIGQPTTVNASMEVGSINQQVEVVGTAEAVQTSTSGNIGNVFSERAIKDLPIVGTRGRNPLDLTLAQPGVVSGSNTGGGTHVNGARDRAWNFTLDGIDTNETSAGGSRFSPLRVNPDMLAEFRVLTSNPTAEYGRNSGGQVAMITRSGSNEFHGSGFWFYRTPRFQANEWENNVNNIRRPQFVQNIYGGSVGGPIWKNKTFFFVNTQVLRAASSSTVTRTVLTETARQGILRYRIGDRNRPAGVANASIDAAGNVLPGIQVGTYNVGANDPERAGLDPTVRRLLAATPAPNNFTTGDGLNTAGYTFAGASTEQQEDYTVRLDQIITSSHQVFARIAWGRQDTLCDSGNGGLPLFPGRECIVNTTRDPRNMAFNWRWTISPVLTNEAVFGENRFTFGFDQPFGSLNEYSLNAPVDLVESTTFGNTRTLRTWQFIDNIAYVRGAHQLKLGTNLRFQRHTDLRGSIAGLNSSPELNFSTSVNTVDPGTFNIPKDINVSFDQPTFQQQINMLLGRVGTRSQGFVAQGNAFQPGLFKYRADFNEYDFYAQDTWKLTRNFTLDLGLRWEIKMAPSSPDGVYRPDRPVTAGSAPSNTLRWVEGKLFENSWKNLGPSIGFAWDPLGDGRTSIRSNYRIAYDRLPTFLPSSAIFPNIPGSTFGISDQEYGRLGGRLAGVSKLSPPSQKPEDLRQPAPFSANNIAAFDPNFKMPVTHQWAFDVQRELRDRLVLDVAYLGRRAYHLFGANNVNQPDVYSNGFINEFNIVKAGGESDLINRLTSSDARRRTGESGSAMYRRLFPADFTNNAAGTLANRIATQLQGGRSVTDLSGAGPFALIPFPQFMGGMTVIDSNDYSTYHSLQAQIERRFSSGNMFQFSYTWSKSLDTRSYDPVFTLNAGSGTQTGANNYFNIYNRRLNYARSDFDRTHVVQSTFVYEFPFGKGRRFGRSASGVTQRVIGGWETAGMLRILSGRPFTVFSGFATVTPSVASTADCTGCSRSFGTVHEEGGLVWYLTPEERAKFSAPAAGWIGNTGRNFFEGPGSFNLDLTLMKRTTITERVNFELRVDATNVTNTPTFGFPTATYSSTLFGRIRDTVSSFSRKVQLGAKINF